MDVRKNFRRQKKRHSLEEADLSSGQPRLLPWQEEVIQQMSLKIEKFLSKYSDQLSDLSSKNPEIAEDLQRIAEKKPPRRISFDDLGGILEMLNDQKE